jgi:ribosomal protein S18 acetylase RimI-like enzyme
VVVVVGVVGVWVVVGVVGVVVGWLWWVGVWGGVFGGVVVWVSALVMAATTSHRHFLGSAVLFFRQRSGVARLYSLATQPEARGRGVGAALLEAAAEAARHRGCRALRLEVRTDNTAAIGLYERAGFQRIGRYECYYQDGADAWRYEKPLD